MGFKQLTELALITSSGNEFHTLIALTANKCFLMLLFACGTANFLLYYWSEGRGSYIQISVLRAF